MYAPIVLFAFNRLESLERCVSSLKMNSESVETDLIVYVDGPRKNREGEVDKVIAVREYVKSITGFRSLSYSFSEENKKLGPSIIAGVTEVMNKYGKAIVIEDDLLLGKNFLSFINQGLDLYERDKEVFSICGHTCKVKRPNDYVFDAYFCSRSSSWGWATWVDRWNSVDWRLKDWSLVKNNAQTFNKWGGSDLFGMLNAWKKGLNQSWAIRFSYNQFAQDKVALFPMISHVKNDGFDGEGTNCKKWSRFKYEFDDSDIKDFKYPDIVVRDKRLYKEALRYHSIWIRIYSRIMYVWYDIINR